ncbi:hypothetical protein ONS95_003197 [Cadophora gregata]|uniref:uncharacterized protein n=1 Tax=Cadophora gregata TaxID=51156 RepID=UPI0026DDB210|nr:uncharacterized protein ONS95_003197 [Cadophora gregata]KAK0108386.1 hypothetical protein ONS95_003197 [Cadophora gregata]KAK0109021.1 hypothetical protein ONS96_002855 [Cadophora gregata f. sp. sojae]
MDLLADSTRPFHVEPSGNRSAASPKRSPSFSSARPRSRERAAPPLSHNALSSRPVTSADTQGGNLNRWSKSTNSSTISHAHKRSNSSARRMSLGAGLSFLDTSSPPRKLQKPHPSTTASPTSQIKVTRPAFDPPAISLPPINTLPSLQTSLMNNSSPLTGPTTPSPSTAQILSAAARSVDYFGKGWEDSSLGPRDFSHRRSPSTSRSANFGPSPVLQSAFSTDSRRQFGEEEEERPRSRGHSRHRSQTKGSSSSNRSSKQPSQKAMLSKALQKANTAVLLDNAQNFEGAMQAYSEACTLLQQVMLRSSGDDDRRKLEAIRNTYTSRISELKKIAPHLEDDGKALPARPESDGRRSREDQVHDLDEDEEQVIIETATVTRIVNDPSYITEPPQSRSISASQLPQRRESLLQSGLDTLQYRPKNPSDLYGRSYSKSPMRERVTETDVQLGPPMESMYMPPPLSPRRPASPLTLAPQLNHQGQQSADLLNTTHSGVSPAKGHNRVPSNESMSWLDTIDESGDSAASSVHSRSSSLRLRRKYIRAPNGATGTEFDTALDAAIEAAYDEGFEPMDPAEPTRYDFDDDDEIVANVRRKVELAKERVRQSEREAAIHTARDKERKRLLQKKQEQLNGLDDDYEGNESEEEERMLEEMTRGYVMDDFEFGLQSKSALPRESDSSGFSGRTWNSSIGSNPTTAGTSLSTVTEASMLPQLPALQSKTPPPMHPPPLQALPPPPSQGNQPPPIPVSNSQGVRSRRLSGQNAKQLKIETTTRMPSSQAPPSMLPPRLPNSTDHNHPKTADLPQQRQPMAVVPGRPAIPQSARQASSPFPGATSPIEVLSRPTPTLHQTFTNESDQLPRSGSPGRGQSRGGLRKNFSSSSLKNMKSRNLSVSNVDDGGSDLSPNTPLSSQFIGRDPSGKLPAMPTLPTPIAAAFKDKLNGMPAGGMYLFNSDIHSPESPGSPSPLSAGAPIPLEPCPTEFLLRPFWLMRALYQTIAHPRGGYLSTKLFIPRDVWRVKGVKIKGLEDKIANCDFLTAALMKLAQVDTFDADAVLEEMQSLEGVLEQVQATLTKKLGNEVGVQGSGGMFKDASTGGESETSNVTSKSGSMSSKSSSFSWRRLRSKNSGVGLSNAYSNKTPVDGPREGLTMATLPMTSTSVAKVRFAKRDVTQLQFSGPNANYMSALARLFDAAQTLDQIARQVEDPGLRHADKTQVGLELCTRHAAEFFGFYICRFVLTDVGMLLDKFLKRGTEWVML